MEFIIKLNNDNVYYEEVKEEELPKPKFRELEEEPRELDAKTYNVDGVHVFIGYRVEGGIPYVYKVVLHTFDSERQRELNAVSSLLTLALKAGVPYGVIINQLRNLNDEFYRRVADVLQTFLAEFGVMEPPREEPVAKQETILSFTLSYPEKDEVKEVDEEKLAVCPVCGKRTLVVENGCYTCINPECGWSKCEV